MSDQLEYALETQALDDGKVRYLKKLEISTKGKALLDRNDLRLLIRQALPLVSLQIRSKLGEERKGRHSQASQVLQHLDPDLIALAGLSATFRVSIAILITPEAQVAPTRGARSSPMSLLIGVTKNL